MLEKKLRKLFHTPLTSLLEIKTDRKENSFLDQTLFTLGSNHALLDEKL